MNGEEHDLVEAAARWLESVGVREDLAPITAGLHDIAEAVKKIQEGLLPPLLQLLPSQRDDALSIIIDLIVELEHISRHADDAVISLIAVRDFLDVSPRSGG